MALSVRISAVGVAFLSQIAIARLLGVREYGVFVYAMSCLSILAIPASLGLESASLRFVAEHRGRGEWDLLKGFLEHSRRIAFIVSLVVASLAAGLVSSVATRLTRSQQLTFWLACLVLPAFVQLRVVSSCLQALKQVARAQIPADLVRPLVLVGTLAAVRFLWSEELSAPVAMALNLFSVTGALLLAWYLLRSVTPRELYPVVPAFRGREWLSTAYPMMFIGGLGLVLSQTDVLMVGGLLDTTRAGIYSAATRLSGLMLLGLLAVNMIAAPTIAELHAQGRRADLQRSLRIAARLAAAFAAPSCLVLALGGRQLLGLFGAAFVTGHWALMILALGQLFNASAGSVGYLMTMTGRERTVGKILLVVAIMNILLNATLIPLAGLAGAAVATSISTVVWNAALLWYSIRRLGLNPSILPLRDST